MRSSATSHRGIVVNAKSIPSSMDVHSSFRNPSSQKHIIFKRKLSASNPSLVCVCVCVVMKVCSPSRAALLTGRSPNSVGVGGNGRPMDVDVATMADVFLANGYRTGHVGKWHLGSDPTRFGFQRWCVVPLRVRSPRSPTINADKWSARLTLREPFRINFALPHSWVLLHPGSIPTSVCC